MEPLEDRTVLAASGLATAVPIAPTGSVTAAISTIGEEDLFRIDVAETGRLTARAAPSNPLGSRLSLLGPQGELLIQSDGASATDRADRITQHLAAGTYFLRVEGLGGGTGSYTLTTEFLPATPPFQPVPVASWASALATGDFNGDGISDLVVGGSDSAQFQFSVLLGLGDGTFAPQQPVSVTSDVFSIAAADFDGDGHLDLALTLSNRVGVLLGRGDGTFQDPVTYAVTGTLGTIITSDFNGDGILDLAVRTRQDVAVLLGQGGGNFQGPRRFATEGRTLEGVALVARDFNGDGHSDLAVTNVGSNDISILLGNGDGTFQDRVSYRVGTHPGSIVGGDFNGDGHWDLAVTNALSNDISILLGNGDGTFQAAPVSPAAGDVPLGLITADFNGDGRLDLVASAINDNQLLMFLGRGDGTFQDAVLYTAGDRPVGILTGDFNGDGLVDVAAGNRQGRTVTILLGQGNGTFADLGRVPVMPDPGDLAAGDFNGDGRLDLAQSVAPLDGTRVLLGQGDGMFQPPLFVPSGLRAFAIATDDFDGDGTLDMAVGRFTNDIIVFLGGGDGTFRPKGAFPVGLNPGVIVQGDFNGDGHPDLATMSSSSPDVVVLLGRGDGTFPSAVRYPIGGSLASLVTGDFNGDGHLDLAATTTRVAVPQVALLLGKGDGDFLAPRFFASGRGAGTMVTGDFDRDGNLDVIVGQGARMPFAALLLGQGDGTFQSPRQVTTGEGPARVQGDFNSDGIPDFAATGYYTGAVYVVLGRGDGTFQAPISVPVGDNPSRLRTGDFNGDGRLDLVMEHFGGSNAQETYVLLGRGDGTFQAPLRSTRGTAFTSTSVAASDLNGDGSLDLVTARPFSSDAAVLLGVGDGTVQSPVPRPLGTTPVAVVSGDFNRDGRPDLAAADSTSNSVAVALGLGDGTYQAPTPYPVGARPASVALADFTGDGIIDLAVANAGSNDVSVLVGRPDGTFQSQVRYPAGTEPIFVMAGDLNGDGIPDLATANYLSGDISVLYGRAGGTFQPEVRAAAGPAAISLARGDFNGDRQTDLAVANGTADQVSVLLRRPDGSFQAPLPLAVGRLPRSVVAADFNGDGTPDLATANYNSDDLSVLLGRGDGTFQSQVRYPAGKYPSALLTADVNGDGLTDLAAANELGTETSILVGLGDGTFVPSDLVSNAIRSTPVVADLNGDGAADVAVLNRRGDILLRLGRPGEPGAFDAPRVVNPDPGSAARELALVAGAHGPLLAALDARGSSVSLYPRGAGGRFTRIAGPAVPGALPVRLAAGDVNGDGLGDLAVATAGSREVFVYLQRPAGVVAPRPPGSFGPAPDYRAGVGVRPGDLALADADGDGRPDVVVTSQVSGDVTVLGNDPGAPFSSPARFRAGTGLYFLDDLGGVPVARSGERTAGLVAGRFDADALADLVVVNSGSDSFSVLPGSGGGLLNPQPALTFATGARPTRVVSGRFNGDGHLDLAVLNQGSATLSIFLGDGHGGFTENVVRDAVSNPLPLRAGNAPAGLALADANGDGRFDLLVGNEFGDVLLLLGNGDGTFQPYQRADRNIALAVADVNGDGRDDFIFGNEGLDRVSVQYSAPGQSFVQDRRDGLLAPGAVSVTDLNRDGLPDLVVANSGANDVLVYLGTGGGQFGPGRSFFAGTSPAGITIADVNADERPDLVVANEGSNDVTLLLSQGEADAWTLTPGPRLRAGAGPVSTTVRDVTGDGIADLLVTDSLSDSVAMLPGVGQGFFDDRAPVTFQTGAVPRQALVGNFDGAPGLDLVAIDFGSNDLTFVSHFTAPGTTAVRIASGGEGPVAALAGDFNGDGLDDLLVAHNGDGAVSLLFGRGDGLVLQEVGFLIDLPHPTALALAEVGENGAIDVYVSGEGSEAVQRLAFAADFGPIALATSDTLAAPGSVRVQVPDVLPLRDSTVAIVATLLTVRPDGNVPGEPGETNSATGREESGPAEITETLVALADGFVGGEEAFAAEMEQVEPASNGPDRLLPFVTGQEEMLEQRPPATRDEILPPPPELPSPRKEEKPEDEPEDVPPAVLDEFWQVLAADASPALEGDILPPRRTASCHSGDQPIVHNRQLPAGTCPEGREASADQDLPPALGQAQAEVTRTEDGAGSGSDTRRGTNVGEQWLAAPLVTALFASGLFRPSARSASQTTGVPGRRSGRISLAPDQLSTAR